MSRYQQLIQIIDQTKPKTIFEFGTFDGTRAIEMIMAAKKHQKEVFYTGLDLFETATAEKDAEESNVKPHHMSKDVYEKIKQATGLDDKHLQLCVGDSRSYSGPITADFTFIDGGHSIQTIAHDFEISKQSKMIVLDDFYAKDETGCMDIEKWGCNKLVEKIKGGVLPAKDPVFKDGKRCGLVQMAIFPAQKRAIQVKTQNVGSDHDIQENVKYALSQFHPFRIAPFKVHEGQALMCAGGPSLESQFLRIMRMARDGAQIFAVKSAHDRLIANGIVPFACILLDPRGHVKDFIDNPHPEVNYIVASMCHRSVFQTLQAKKARTWLYHAAVGAGEDKLIQADFANSGNQSIVGGGCSSATRGMMLAYLMGFRRMHLFGYDLCYDGPGEKRVPISVIDGQCFEQGNIWTDYEKVAQANEIHLMMKDLAVEVDVHGGTVASLIRDQIPRRQEFSSVFREHRTYAL